MRLTWIVRYLDAMHYSIDGNFHLGLKNKATDVNDVALSENAAYFVNTKDFKTFLRDAPKPKKEVGNIRPAECILMLTRSTADDLQSLRGRGSWQIQRPGIWRHRDHMSPFVHAAELGCRLDAGRTVSVYAGETEIGMTDRASAGTYMSISRWCQRCNAT